MAFFNRIKKGSGLPPPTATNKALVSVDIGGGVLEWQEQDVAETTELTNGSADVTIVTAGSDSLITHTIDNLIEFYIIDPTNGNEEVTGTYQINRNDTAKTIEVVGGLDPAHQIVLKGMPTSGVALLAASTDIQTLDFSNVNEYDSVSLGDASGDKIYYLNASNGDGVFERVLIINK